MPNRDFTRYHPNEFNNYNNINSKKPENLFEEDASPAENIYRNIESSDKDCLEIIGNGINKSIEPESVDIFDDWEVIEEVQIFKK